MPHESATGASQRQRRPSLLGAWKGRPTEHVARKNKGFVLKPLPGKGFGIVSTKAFQKGKRVSIGNDVLMYRSERAHETLATAFMRLSRDDKRAVLSLANQSDPETSKRRAAAGVDDEDGYSMEEVQEIWDTNCYAREDGECIYRMGSRFNHSCRPNCEIDPDDTGQWPDDCDECFLQIHRNIKAGEEMVVTYLTETETNWDLSKRRSHIWENWVYVHPWVHAHSM